MKLPLESEDRYLKEVLSNTSLEDLPDEEWKLIEGFENYAISCYGRVKSLERWAVNPTGAKRKIQESIMRLQAFRYFNKHLQSHFYNIRCTLSTEGKKYGKSLARLVYHHFVEKIDMDDDSFYMSFKDANRFHVHYSNLEKVTRDVVRRTTLNSGRGKKGNYKQAVSQYTVAGDFIASYENVYAASHALGIHPTYILSAVSRKRITAGTFCWFATDYTPVKEDFIPERKNKSSAPDKIFNDSLWKKLGCPVIDKNHPPACMNLSIQDLPGEIWKPVPDLESYFSISSKGRVKRLNTWTTKKNKTFWKEHIVSLFVVKSGDMYYIIAQVSYNGKSLHIPIVRMLYYCFVERFDLHDKRLVVKNDNSPQWDIDLSKLHLQTAADILTQRNKENATKVRSVFNSQKTFNHALWEKLGRPAIDKNNPPAVFDLSLRDLPDELWNPLPGHEGKYVISNKGRVKRLSGWRGGNRFYEEEQVISLHLRKDHSPYLYFILHPKEYKPKKILLRSLYFCFVESFDLSDRTLRVINANKKLWDIDLSKLSLQPMIESLKKGK